MKALRTTVALGACMVVVLQAQTTSIEVTAADLRARITALFQDTKSDNRPGSSSFVMMTDYAAEELARGGARALEGSRYYQEVRALASQIDLPRAKLSVIYEPLTAGRPVSPGIGFVPLTGAFGLNLQRKGKLSAVTIVPGGRLGGPDAITPRAASKQFVLFRAPQRANGQADYQLHRYRDELARYSTAAGIGIASFELLPRAFARAMTDTQYFLERSEGVGSAGRLPPMIAVTRKLAEEVNRQQVPLAISFEFDSRAIPATHPIRNALAVVPGTDERLRSEYVVVAAPMDVASAAGVAALLEAAEQLAAEPLKRSIIFVAPVAYRSSVFGAEDFVDHAFVRQGRVKTGLVIETAHADAALSPVDTSSASLSTISTTGFSAATLRAIDSAARAFTGLRVSSHVAAAAVCAAAERHFSRSGVPTARVVMGALPPDSIDYPRLERATRWIVEAVRALANAPAPLQDAMAIPALRDGCK